MKKGALAKPSAALMKVSGDYLTAISLALSDDFEGVRTIDLLLERAPMDARLLLALAQSLMSAGKANHQKNAANKKHAQTRKAMEFATRYWDIHGAKFNKKIEIAEVIADKALTRFKVTVKPSTVARDWLKGLKPPRNSHSSPTAVAYAEGEYFTPKKTLSIPSKK